MLTNKLSQSPIHYSIKHKQDACIVTALSKDTICNQYALLTNMVSSADYRYKQK